MCIKSSLKGDFKQNIQQNQFWHRLIDTNNSEAPVVSHQSKKIIQGPIVLYF